MTISLFLLVGGFFVFLLVLSKRPIINVINENNWLVQKLKKRKSFKNPSFVGMVLFMGNGVMFLITMAFLYLLMFLLIPYMHLIVMIIAVISSIFFWAIVHHAWNGTNKDRLKIATIGSSFYIIVCIIFAYWYVSYQPSHPEEDTFMAAIGFTIAIFVTSVAAVTCSIYTGFVSRTTKQ